MKNKKYHTVATFSKFIRNIVEGGKIDTQHTNTWPLTSNTQIHNRSISWIYTNRSIQDHSYNNFVVDPYTHEGCPKWSRDCLPFCSTWVHTHFCKVRVGQSFVSCEVICRSLLAFLSIFSRHCIVCPSIYA